MGVGGFENLKMGGVRGGGGGEGSRTNAEDCLYTIIDITVL